MPLNVFPKVKTRIAPSPTGNLHLGTVRTALYNVLFAQKHQGEFFFRLEDTDRQRSEEQFTQEILEGFKWLNISWDTPSSLNPSENLVGLGEDGIVRQSLREAVHSSYIERLIKEGKAYLDNTDVDTMRKIERHYGIEITELPANFSGSIC
jgi:glutamyl/glutaminyl-tRNA synthetase